MNGIRVSLNGNGELYLNEKTREIANWNIGDKISVYYNEQLDLLELRNITNVFVIEENGILPLSIALIEEADLSMDNDFKSIYDQKTDLLTLQPIHKFCIVCESEQGTIYVAIDKYICEKCHSKLLSMQKVL